MQFGRGIAFKGPLARSHLVQHHAQGKNIGAVVERTPRDLLRGHVGGRAHYHAPLRLGRSERGVVGAFRARVLGQAKVQHFYATVRGQHYVAGLQVAVNDTLFMRRGERVRQRGGDLDNLFRGQPSRRNAMIERHSLHQLHGEEVNALGLFHGKNSNDMRMVQGGNGAGFALKPQQTLVIARHFGRQHFQRDVTAQFAVGGAVYLAHATRAHPRGDSIMRKCAADQDSCLPERLSGAVLLQICGSCDFTPPGNWWCPPRRRAPPRTRARGRAPLAVRSGRQPGLRRKSPGERESARRSASVRARKAWG